MGKMRESVYQYQEVSHSKGDNAKVEEQQSNLSILNAKGVDILDRS
jgi:hypothetical protein